MAETKYYDSPLTGQELDEAFRKLAKLDASVSSAVSSAESASACAETAEQCVKVITDNQPALQYVQQNADNISAVAQNGANITAVGQSISSIKSVANSITDIQSTAQNLENIKLAPQSAQEAADSSILAQSWAAGGTDSREGENTNNAQYWARQAQSIAQGQLGWFETEQVLQTAHPTGQNGQWAIIGSTDTIWTWDSDTDSWVNSGAQVDLSNYYTIPQANTTFATVAQGELAQSAVQSVNGIPGPALVLTPQNIGAAARPNLLINSYFSGGGSQLGGDRLPINQRGSTTYTSGKCIDMGSLDLNNGGLSLSLKSDCIRLTQTSVAGGTNAQAMVMRFPASKITPGGTYTLSALVRGTGSARILLFADAVVQESSVYVQCTSAWQLVTATFSMPSTISSSSGRIYLYADTDGLLRYTEYLAVKLEEGDTQSLACQMPNGLWQLLPQSDFDYASQFAQCQRFFVRMKFGKSATIANVMRAGTWYSIDLPLQTPMYKIPTVTWTCAPLFVSDSVPVPAPAISMPGSYLNLGAALTTSPAKADYVFASTDGYIDISAELS